MIRKRLEYLYSILYLLGIVYAICFLTLTGFIDSTIVDVSISLVNMFLFFFLWRRLRKDNVKCDNLQSKSRLGATVLVTSSIIMLLAASRLFTLDFSQQDFGIRDDSGLQIVQMLLIAPVLEELFHRFYFIDLFRNKVNVHLLSGISILFFAAFHFEYYRYYIFLGLFLTLLRFKYESLLINVLCHSAYNLFCINWGAIMRSAFVDYNRYWMQVADMLYPAIGLLALVSLIIVYHLASGDLRRRQYSYAIIAVLIITLVFQYSNDDGLRRFLDRKSVSYSLYKNVIYDRENKLESVLKTDRLFQRVFDLLSKDTEIELVVIPSIGKSICLVEGKTLQLTDLESYKYNVIEFLINNSNLKDRDETAEKLKLLFTGSYMTYRASSDSNLKSNGCKDLKDNRVWDLVMMEDYLLNNEIVGVDELAAYVENTIIGE